MNNNYKLPLERDGSENIKKRLRDALQSLLEVYDPLKSAGRTPYIHAFYIEKKAVNY